jgi:hypothetical protein
MLGVFATYDQASLRLLLDYWISFLAAPGRSEHDRTLAEGIVAELREELAQRSNN